MSPKFNFRPSFDTLSRRKTALAILTVLFTFPLITPSQYYMLVLAEAFILGLLALSYDIILGYTGLVSFGHAAFFGVGAYVSALLLRNNVSFLLVILAAIAFGVLVGLVMGVFSLRVGGGIYYAMVTLAFAGVIHAVFSSRWAIGLSGGETGLRVPRPDFMESTWFLHFALAISVTILIILCVTVVRDSVKKGNPARAKVLYSTLMIAFLVLLIYTAPQKLDILLGDSRIGRMITNKYFYALIPLTVCYFISNRIVNSPLGRILIAIRENEERTEMLGYNVFKYRLVSSSISGVFATIAGALYAPFILIVRPDLLEATVTVNVLLYSILGGMGTLIGPMMGAGIVTIFERALSPYLVLELFGRELRLSMLVLGVGFLLIVLFMPYGIVGTLKAKGVSVRKLFEKLIKPRKTSARKGHATREGVS